MKRIGFMAAIILTACTMLRAQQPANEWVPLGSGEYPLPTGQMNVPELVHARVIWLPEIEAALLNHGETRLYDTKEFRWTVKPTTTPPKREPDRSITPQGYCWLPGLKRVLLLKQEYWYSPDRKPAMSWLLDPISGVWEPLDGVDGMSDKSAAFSPAPGRDGLRSPIWGTLVFDGHNHEAVSFGGGGVWGRVGGEKEKVAVGDWIFDEAAKRVRRLTTDDAGRTPEARKWYPGHCGTWLFSEAEKKWRALEQPLGRQPSGRILPGMAYDAGEKKIVLFGGDDLARCFDDTWVYDCVKRTWSKIETKNAPTARAAQAMVYLPDQKVILLAGGYGGGWKPLKDVWVFETAKGEWTKLSLTMPAPAMYCSADYDPARKNAVLVSFSGARYNKKVPVHLLRLDLATAARAPAETAAPLSAFHCKASQWRSDLPDEWLTGAGAPEKPDEVLARIKALPVNTWKDMNPPKKARERTWGIYIYDPRSHKGFAWGGGHSGYPGAEITEYHLPINRWVGMKDPANYNPVWLHGMVGGPPGISFGGWSLLPSHARKSYGIDPISDTVITYSGDVYSIKHSRFVDHIGNFPIDWGGPSYQVAYLTAPHGLYGFAATRSSKAQGWLCRANVASGTWDVVSKDGPGGHGEYDFLVHDTKRDRALYFKYKGGEVWAFDFKSKIWSKDEPVGKAPAIVMGDGTYIPAMDAVLTVFADVPKGPEKLFFYRCDERKWYTAPSAGDPFRGSNSAKDYSPIWDQELGIIVRITQCGFADKVNVHVMRLDPATMQLAPVE